MATTVKTRRQGHAGHALLIGAAVLVALFALNKRHPAAFNLAELKASDLRMGVQRRPQPTGAVVIAAIDDKSIAELGHWPWPRSVLARLEKALSDYQAAVVGYDVLFSERDEDDTQAEQIIERFKAMGMTSRAVQAAVGAGNDVAFAEAIKEQGSTSLAYAFESHFEGSSPTPYPVAAGYKTAVLDPPPANYNLVREMPGEPPTLISARAYLPPVPILNSAARGTSYVDINADADGVMRSEIGVIRFGSRFCVPLYLALAQAYLKNAPLHLDLGPAGVERVSLGEEEIPVDKVGQMLVRFRGPPGTFSTYSISDIIGHRVPARDLAGKIILVGLTAHALGDREVTPAGADFPGVEIHANAIDNVLRGDFLRRDREGGAAGESVATVLLVFAISFAAVYLSPLWSAAAALWVTISFAAYAQYWLTFRGMLIDVVVPLAAAVTTYMFLATYHYFVEEKARRYVRAAFEHYLNPEVIASLVDDPAGLRLFGERRHLAILFADIVNFTARAERSEPERLVALLNAYMTEMTRIIFESQGVVDKFMGDGIMAFWGAPIEIHNPARAALDCALKMLEGLDRLRRSDERFADVNIGIGVATGDAVVGNLGSEQRFDYSAIGDTVNLASRLEGLTRHFGVHLLANRQTVVEAETNYCVREVGLVKVKGKEQLVPIVDVAGQAGNGIDPDFYRRFNDALTHIRNGEASAAVATLNALRQHSPNDGLVNLYLEKLAEAVDGEPTEMVFEFETK